MALNPNGGAPRKIRTPDPVRLKTMRAAARDDDHRGLLVALRDRIIATVSSDDCPPRDLSSLSGKLLEITTALDAMDRQAAQYATEEPGSDEPWHWDPTAV